MRASVICKIIIKKLLYLTLKEIKILFVETLKCDCSECKEPHIPSHLGLNAIFPIYNSFILLSYFI